MTTLPPRTEAFLRQLTGTEEWDYLVAASNERELLCSLVNHGLAFLREYAGELSIVLNRAGLDAVAEAKRVRPAEHIESGDLASIHAELSVMRGALIELRALVTEIRKNAERGDHERNR